MLLINEILFFEAYNYVQKILYTILWDLDITKRKLLSFDKKIILIWREIAKSLQLITT